MGKKTEGDHWGFLVDGKMIHQKSFLRTEKSIPQLG